jgi:hypothetical protein
MGAASGRLAVVRKLTVFLTDMRDSIGLLFGPSRADVQEDRKTEARWCQILEEATRNLLHEDAGLGCEL